MSSVAELESAVRQLSEEGLREFRQWFQDFDYQRWDRQIERDVAEGKLDELADEALAEHRSGRTRSL